MSRGSGYGYALAAYTFWGVAPVYFVWVNFAAPLEILAHRIAWSVPLLLLLVWLGRHVKTIFSLSPRVLFVLFCCAALLSVNWLTFIYGIHTDRMAETSLGYFINPLISIALGAVILSEKLRGWQWLAVGLTAVGIVYEFVTVGSLPWIAVCLALSFGLYGLLRKQIAVPAPVGLLLETLFLAPFAVLYLIFLEVDRSQGELGALVLGGVVTVLPLLWFGAAAIRLPLIILGLFQYLAPSITLVLAILVYNEVLTEARWFSFIMVWVGLVVFTVEGLIRRRQDMRAEPLRERST